MVEWTAKCRTTRVLQWGNVSSDMLPPLPRLQTAARGAQAQARCRRHKTGTHQIRSAPAPICNSTYYILPHTRPPHLHQTPQLPKPYELSSDLASPSCSHTFCVLLSLGPPFVDLASALCPAGQTDHVALSRSEFPAIPLPDQAPSPTNSRALGALPDIVSGRFRHHGCCRENCGRHYTTGHR